jgi:hypothetical protein
LVKEYKVEPVCIGFHGYKLFVQTHSLKPVHYLGDGYLCRAMYRAFVTGSADPWGQAEQNFIFHALSYHVKDSAGRMIHRMKNGT